MELGVRMRNANQLGVISPRFLASEKKAKTSSRGRGSHCSRFRVWNRVNEEASRSNSILPRESEELWLKGEGEKLTELLRPFPSERMEAWPVSKLVNSPANDHGEVLVEVTDLL